MLIMTRMIRISGTAWYHSPMNRLPAAFSTPAQGPLPVSLNASGMLAAESRHAPAFSMEFQEHAFHEVLLLLRGAVRGVVRLHDRRAPGGEPHTGEVHVALEPGDCLVLPAGTAHRLQDNRASTVVVVAFTADFLEQCPGRTALWDEIVSWCPATVARGGGLRERSVPWRDLVALPQRPEGPERVVLVQSAFNAFLVALRHRAFAAPSADALERVSRLVQSLKDRVHEPWTLDTAAGECGLSRRRFSELFRQVAGETFVTCLQRQRVTMAQSLMAGGRYSIAGAAYAAGFEDLAHFYRVFRRHAGCPPGAWLSGEGALTGDYPSGAAERERG